MNHVVLSSVLLSVAVIPAYSIDKFVKTHQELLRLYPCRDPQERVFDVEDIVPLEEYKKIPVKKVSLIICQNNEMSFKIIANKLWGQLLKWTGS